MGGIAADNKSAERSILFCSLFSLIYYLLSDIHMVMDGLLYEDYSKMDEIIDDFYGSFDECIKKIKALNPDAELFVRTLCNLMFGGLAG